MADESTTTSEEPTREPPSATARRLERSRSDRWLTGVCGGLGAYFGLDPLIFRIAVIVLTVAGGAGLWLYLAAWLLLPEEGHHRSIAQHALGSRSLVTIAAIVLIAIGVGHLSDELDFFDGDGLIWALLLIGGGVYLFRASGGTQPTDTESPPTAPDAPGAPPPPPPPAPPSWPSWPSSPAPAPPAASGRSITPYVISVLLLGGGVVALLDTADVVDVSPVPVLAAGVLISGLALVTTAWWGRARGLIPVGILLAIALAVATTADSLDVPLRGETGERRWVPTDVADLRSTYRAAAGSVTIDLSQVQFAGRAPLLTASVGFGELIVLVPEAVGVDVDARTAIGEVELFGHEEGGLGIERSRFVPPAIPGAGSVRLRVRSGIGRVEVRRGGPMRILSPPAPFFPPEPFAPERPVAPEEPNAAA